eukprot:s448_g11.t2
MASPRRELGWLLLLAAIWWQRTDLVAFVVPSRVSLHRTSGESALVARAASDEDEANGFWQRVGWGFRGEAVALDPALPVRVRMQLINSRRDLRSKAQLAPRSCLDETCGPMFRSLVTVAVLAGDALKKKGQGLSEYRSLGEAQALLFTAGKLHLGMQHGSSGKMRLLGGDFLYAEGQWMLADLGSLPAIRLTSRMIQEPRRRRLQAIRRDVSDGASKGGAAPAELPSFAVGDVGARAALHAAYLRVGSYFSAVASGAAWLSGAPRLEELYVRPDESSDDGSKCLQGMGFRRDQVSDRGLEELIAKGLSDEPLPTAQEPPPTWPSKEKGGPKAALQASFRCIGKELGSVNAKLDGVSLAEPAASELVREEVLRLFASGGKRLRPALTLLTAAATGASEAAMANVAALAAAVEVLHSASLVHDDILDDADKRRGEETAHLRLGERSATLVGDFLFATASVLVAEIGSLPTVLLISKVVADFGRGELAQSAVRFEAVDYSLEDYLAKSFYKTASLLAAACHAAAVLSKQERDPDAFESQCCYRFGAYELGKPALADLKEGNLGAPVLFAAQPGALEPAARAELLQAIDRRLSREGDLDLVRRYVAEGKGVEKSKALARRFVDLASLELDALEPGEAREGLRLFAEFVVRPKPAVLSNERTGDICLPRSVPGTRDGWMRTHEMHLSWLESHHGQAGALDGPLASSQMHPAVLPARNRAAALSGGASSLDVRARGGRHPLKLARSKKSRQFGGGSVPVGWYSDHGTLLDSLGTAASKTNASDFTSQEIANIVRSFASPKHRGQALMDTSTKPILDRLPEAISQNIVNVAWAPDCPTWEDREGGGFLRILQRFLQISASSLGVEWVTLATIAKERGFAERDVEPSMTQSLGPILALLVLACAGLSFRAFIAAPRPRAAAPAALATGALMFPTMAWAEEEMDAATRALKDATEETFGERPKIDLGEYRGDDYSWNAIGFFGIAFIVLVCYESWKDELGGGLVPSNVKTDADDYFNPDFDPYKGMNIKKETKEKENA